MRKVLALALISMFFSVACQRAEESAPAAPEATATEAAPAPEAAPAAPEGAPAEGAPAAP
jgi:nitrous oxide reductase accessory protein NosL